MSLKNRSILIVCGFAIFIILGPAAIFLARGLRYDFAKHEIVKTGTLVIRTDPKGATVALNNEKLDGLAPLTKRFLPPGEYVVELTKEGFRPWKKRVTVNEQMVTYLPSAGAKKTILFLREPAKTILPTTTIDLFNPPGEPQTQEQYYISPEARKLMLKNLDGKDIELISESLPAFTKEQIIATPGKQIFLLLDQTLYQVASSLKKIAAGVDYVSWNEDALALIYGNSHEIWFYSPPREKSELATRSSKTLGQAIYNHATGYLFVVEDQTIKAIEYDNLGQPNVYVLAETNTPLPKFTVNQEGTEVIYLDGDELLSLKIR